MLFLTYNKIIVFLKPKLLYKIYKYTKKKVHKYLLENELKNSRKNWYRIIEESKKYYQWK